MFTRLLTIWERVRASLWALPLAMVLGAGLLAVATLNAQIEIGNDPVWFLYSGTAKQAPQFLSNLVSAMITMATLAISITMVVLTLAAQQLGPRLIRNFMADRRTQSSLGLFVSTVVYLLLVLRSTYGDAGSVANLAVTVGTALVFLSVVTLLLFVHHLARSIIADNVIDRVGAQLDADIRRLLPSEIGQASGPPSRHQTRKRSGCVPPRRLCTGHRRQRDCACRLRSQSISRTRYPRRATRGARQQARVCLAADRSRRTADRRDPIGGNGRKRAHRHAGFGILGPSTGRDRPACAVARHQRSLYRNRGARPADIVVAFGHAARHGEKRLARRRRRDPAGGAAGRLRRRRRRRLQPDPAERSRKGRDSDPHGRQYRPVAATGQRRLSARLWKSISGLSSMPAAAAFSTKTTATI